MEITPSGRVGTRRANPDYFVGEVWQEPIAETPTAPPLHALKVSFAPGARTNWHTHPLGQTLYVLSGVGLVQARGGPAREIREGDTVWIPPGEEHWHGAVATRAMTHIALQHAEGGAAATWLEPVSDADYSAACA